MKKQEAQLQPQTTNENNTGKISRLLNSIYYFFDCVFIISREEDYRLIILHHNEIVMDTIYNTLRGAKIAFAKFFGEKAWEIDIQPYWSTEYSPEDDWINEKLHTIKNGRYRREIVF